MTTQKARAACTVLIATALVASSAIAFAQPAQRLAPGTITQAQHPLPDSNGGTLTVRAGMPEHVRQYGPPPMFKALDRNGDGRIDEAEAGAYPPLDNDFLDASGGANTISRAQYETWVKAEH